MVLVRVHTRAQVAVCVARAVQEAPDGRLRRPESVKVVDGCVILVIVVHVECDRVHLIHPERRVHIREGRDGRGHVRDHLSIVRVARHVTRLAGLRTVKDREMVLVRVAEEDRRNGMGSEPMDDLIEQIRWLIKSLCTGPAGEDVAENPHTLAAFLGLEQFVSEEAEHAAKVRVGRVDVVEHVDIVPKVGVERDDPQSPAGAHGETRVV